MEKAILDRAILKLKKLDDKYHKMQRDLASEERWEEVRRMQLIRRGVTESINEIEGFKHRIDIVPQ